MGRKIAILLLVTGFAVAATMYYLHEKNDQEFIPLNASERNGIAQIKII